MSHATRTAGELTDCDDALPWSRDRTVERHFDRERKTLGKAIGSAVEDAEKAGYEVGPSTVPPNGARTG